MHAAIVFFVDFWYQSADDGLRLKKESYAVCEFITSLKMVQRHNNAIWQNKVNAILCWFYTYSLSLSLIYFITIVYRRAKIIFWQWNLNRLISKKKHKLCLHSSLKKKKHALRCLVKMSRAMSNSNFEKKQRWFLPFSCRILALV